MTRSFDIAIAGSGFAGSLMALIARRLGYSVVLIERGKHPRVVIGESSTPLANLLLEELCRRYDLPAIAPLAKWGSWQQKYARIGCGLKRGFTFCHHRLDAPDAVSSIGYEDQLLVAASPHDAISDTHWFRADFDQFLVEQAREAGAEYFDEVRIDVVTCDANGVELGGTRLQEDFEVRAKFLIDATGPRGLLHRALNLGEAVLPVYPATQALWSHFSGVTQPLAPNGAPYPPEDAAVHHVFDGGWIWVLRFNNGIASAGVAATDMLAARLGFDDGATAWGQLIAKIPALRDQFEEARAELPFRHIPRLSFLSQRVCGARWALLPSAAGFIDPLLSMGFPLTLLGVERLARVLEAGLDSPRVAAEFLAYEKKTTEELLATARLIGALYAQMGNFPLFRALCLLYFAAASYAETARRLGKPQLARSFLLYDHSEFGIRSKAIFDRALHVRTNRDSVSMIDEIVRTIEPIDVVGLSRPNARHWYPVDAADLVASRSKVDASEEEIEALLQRCGFHQPQEG